MSDSITRRDMITKGLPAVALAGTVLGAAGALLGQDKSDAAPATPPGAPSAVGAAMAAAYQDGKYALPPLPYPYEALEPHIDRETMTLHHDKHQQGYVNGLNKAIEELADLRKKDEINADTLAGLTRDISFNAGGHIFHTIFFATMAPNAGGNPDGGTQLAQDIKKQFGSIDAFKTHFSKVAGGIKGSGWAVAFYEPIGDQILIAGVGDQDKTLVPSAIPLLLIDVWEHAYYLKYQNKRADYIKAWWNVVNWWAVNDLYTDMRKMTGKK